MDVYIAGALAAFTVDVLIYPFDTLKTRRQSQDYIKTYADGARSGGRNPALAFRGLYQGIGSVMLVTLPAAGVFFSTYELAKTTLSAASSPLPAPAVHAIASASAEAASCLVLTPAELVKQHAQMMKNTPPPSISPPSSSSSSSSSSLRAFRTLFEAGAASRLLTGYGALLARNLPLTALQFPLYEHLRARLQRWPDDETRGEEKKTGGGMLRTGLVAGTSAAAAGAVAAFATTPSDVVKTRTMLMATTTTKGVDAGQEAGEQRPWRVAKRIYRDRGIRGLFRGGGLRSAWTAVGSGLYLGTYAAAKLWLSGEDGVGEEDV